MSITAAQVKELRERTGLGMMKCKKALVESNGDIESAIEIMRKSGEIKGVQMAGRIAAEGIVETKINDKHGIIVEINSETDFVARDENFQTFAKNVMDAAMASKATDVETLMQHQMGDKTLEELRLALIAKIGENINVRRINSINSDGVIGAYVHGGRIGALVALNGGDESLAKDIAMHIAAMKPQFINPEDVSADLVEKEKEIFTAQAKESGKPDEIIEKMIGGRIKKYLNEISLAGQPFVKNPDVTIGALLKEHSASVTEFVCFEVGDGIEKKEENFRDEVMAQAKGTA